MIAMLVSPSAHLLVKSAIDLKFRLHCPARDCVGAMEHELRGGREGFNRRVQVILEFAMEVYKGMAVSRKY